MHSIVHCILYSKSKWYYYSGSMICMVVLYSLVFFSDTYNYYSMHAISMLLCKFMHPLVQSITHCNMLIWIKFKLKDMYINMTCIRIIHTYFYLSYHVLIISQESYICESAVLLCESIRPKAHCMKYFN